MNTKDRLKRLFTAPPEHLQAIDSILERGIPERPTAIIGPLLMGMSASAKMLGVSRVTLWRMIKGGAASKD
jgi:hypothetical protein